MSDNETPWGRVQALVMVPTTIGGVDVLLLLHRDGRDVEEVRLGHFALTGQPLAPQVLPWNSTAQGVLDRGWAIVARELKRVAGVWAEGGVHRAWARRNDQTAVLPGQVQATEKMTALVRFDIEAGPGADAGTALVAMLNQLADVSGDGEEDARWAMLKTTVVSLVRGEEPRFTGDLPRQTTEDGDGAR